MRLFLSVDMEGTTRLERLEEIFRGLPGYDTFRQLMAGDANAVVRGAIEGGATEIVVSDSHGYMCNILPERFDPWRASKAWLAQPPMVSDENVRWLVRRSYHDWISCESGFIGCDFGAYLDHRVSGRKSEWTVCARTCAQRISCGLATFICMLATLFVCCLFDKL